MDLEATAKRVENKDEYASLYNNGIFSVSRLQLCFTRGNKNIR